MHPEEASGSRGSVGGDDPTMKKRRRSLAGLYSLVFILLCACGKQQRGAAFRAVVTEVSDDIITVEPLKGPITSGYDGSFPLINIEKIDFYAGDIVEIEYDGILESDPPQLGRIYGIKMIQEAEESRLQKLVPVARIIQDRLENGDRPDSHSE